MFCPPSFCRKLKLSQRFDQQHGQRRADDQHAGDPPGLGAGAYLAAWRLRARFENEQFENERFENERFEN